MDLNVAGKTAVVTGASRGIGLAIVQALAREGVHVAAGARTLSESLREATGHALAVDLTTADGPAALVAYAEEAFGGIDILVNNLGGGPPRLGGFLSTDDADWQRTFDLSFFSAVRAIRAALPALLERAGTIVNIGSVNSRLALPRLVDYGAAKAALVNLGKALAEEFAPQGVRVNTISPGPVRTDLWTKPGGIGETLARQAGVPLEQFVEQVPVALGLSTGRMTSPEEVAALVLLLISDRAPNINGSDLVIDGGMLKSL